MEALERCTALQIILSSRIANLFRLDKLATKNTVPEGRPDFLELLRMSRECEATDMMMLRRYG